MACNQFSDSFNNGQCLINGGANGNKGSNATNNPKYKVAENDQVSANLTSSISHEINMYCARTGANSSLSMGGSEGPTSEQSLVNLTHSFLESDYPTSTNIAPATFYGNLIEQMDKNIIMLKKSLDKVLEMRVSMAELKLSLKEISSPELVSKAEELNTQLTSLEESHSRFNEMILSLKHEIQPSVNDDVNKVNRDGL